MNLMVPISNFSSLLELGFAINFLSVFYEIGSKQFKNMQHFNEQEFLKLREKAGKTTREPNSFLLAGNIAGGEFFGLGLYSAIILGFISFIMLLFSAYNPELRINSILMLLYILLLFFLAPLLIAASILITNYWYNLLREKKTSVDIHKINDDLISDLEDFKFYDQFYNVYQNKRLFIILSFIAFILFFSVGFFFSVFSIFVTVCLIFISLLSWSPIMFGHFSALPLAITYGFTHKTNSGIRKILCCSAILLSLALFTLLGGILSPVS